MYEDGDLVEKVIDFKKMRNEKGELDESWILTFNAILRWMMPQLFRGNSIPVSIKGTPTEVRSFANVMNREKRYLQSWKDNGLDNPTTYRNKSLLNKGIDKFQRITGLKWPFSR